MMKGQSQIFEQVLLFGIAVVIFVMCFAIFQLYQSNFEFVSANDQVRAVRDLIASNTVELVRFEHLNASVVLSIPSEIGGEWYTMEFNGTHLNVNTSRTDSFATSNLYEMSQGLGGDYVFSGKATSGKGEIVIYKRGYNIILE